MLKIKDDVDLKELEKFGFVKCDIFQELYERTFRKIDYCITKDRFLHKFKDMGYYTEELKVITQDIKRLGIAGLVEKVGD